MVKPLQVLSSSNATVVAVVECYKDNKKLYSRDTDAKGFIELPDEVDMAVVHPLAQCWTQLIVQFDKEITICRCPPILPVEKRWWNRILNGDTKVSCSSISVGVVDIGFSDHTRVSNLTYFSPNPSSVRLPDSHGAQVLRIISNEFDGFEDGLCDEITTLFFDAKLDVESKLAEGIAFPCERLNENLLVDGIDYLSRHGADLINISAGSANTEDSTLLRDAVQLASLRGSLVLAATGNEGCDLVSQPARFGEVIGVGGLGVSNIAPLGSYVEMLQSVAEASNETGSVPRLGEFFRHARSSWGAGLDVVAPSIGVTLTSHDGYATDIEGTSFACPMVVSLLAMSLEGNENYRKAKGLDRVKLAREQLTKICQSVGLDEKYQGMGLPRLGSAQT